MARLRIGRIVGYRGEVVGRRTDCGSYTGDTETVRKLKTDSEEQREIRKDKQTKKYTD